MKKILVTSLVSGLLTSLVSLTGCNHNRAPAEFQNACDQGIAAYTNRDDAEAARLFRLAAEQGSAKANTLLGLMYLSGEGLPVDFDEGILWLKAAAEQGDADGQYWFGFWSGMEVLREALEAPDDAYEERFYSENLGWYKRAADQGHAMALVAFGETYFRCAQPDVLPLRSGLASEKPCPDSLQEIFDAVGAPKSLAELENLYLQSADPGGAKGLVSLGYKFRYSLTVQQNVAEAARLFRLAADRGYSGGQIALGTMYRLGEGVQKNEAQALALYRLAADQLDAQGQAYVGAMLHDGKGVARNGAEAVRFYELAAAQGNANSMAMLARMYRYGEGVPVDNVLAYKWYNITSAFDNDPVAGAERDKLARTMSPDQIAEAQRLSSEWKPANSKGRALSDLLSCNNPLRTK